MASGGARARSGPPADPNALRRRGNTDDFVTLPAEGRQGPEPTWPLHGLPNDREKYIWREWWRKPQAIMWERNGQQYEVAILVRRFAEAEQRDSAIALSTLIRQMMDSLGLTVPGLRSNRWIIAAGPETAVDDETPPPSVIDARNRFRVER